MRKMLIKIFVLSVLVGILFILNPQFKSICPIRTQEVIVRGDSLFGILESGTKAQAEFGYYACHPINRGDLVLYRYAGNREPLIKIVKAVPGDTFALQPDADGYQLLINDRILRNSVGAPYQFDPARANLLQLYVHDYNGQIPNATYLILGNKLSGTVDSSKFGLVSQADILARVIAFDNK